VKHNIMIVDDSVSVLESLKWIFEGEPYHLFVLDNPKDALELIEITHFAVVVVEHSMIKMDGIEFLKQVRKKSPYTIGIIMTGYVDFKEALDCIYPGCVYQYIKKPLDNGEIKQVVKSALVHYEINSESDRNANFN